MNITLPFPRHQLTKGFIRLKVGRKTWHGKFGGPLDESAIAAHPFAPEDRAIMPTVVLNQAMADSIRRDGPGWVFDLKKRH